MIDLSQYSTDELIQLNKEIVEIVRLRRERESQMSMHQFSMNEMVSFDDGMNTITGRIIRFNKKSITVQCSHGTQWRVAPQFLKKTMNGESSLAKNSQMSLLN